MEIKYIDKYRDGGTISILTTEGEYCIDKRLDSKCTGYIFKGYPKPDHSNYIPGIHVEIKQLLENFHGKGHFYTIEALELLKQPGIRIKMAIQKSLKKQEIMGRAIQSYCKRYGHELGITYAFEYLKLRHNINII